MPKYPPIPDENYSRLRAEVRRLVNERGFTVDDLAATAGVSRRNLMSLLNAELRNERPAQGSLALWFHIADTLGVPLSELLKTLDS